MMKQGHLYECFARILSYPWTGDRVEVEAALDRVSASHPEECETISPLRDFIGQATEQKLQELYTQTFEVQPICYLDVGYVLFGEDYKRGQFLVHLNREHEKAQNLCGTELPDHLPNLLRLLPKIQDAKFAEELSRIFLIPALEKMLPGFKDKGNVYGAALQSLSRILQRDFPAEAGELGIQQGALL